MVSWYDRRFLSAARRLEQALEGRHEVYLFVRRYLSEERIREWVGPRSNVTFAGLDEEIEESLARWRQENDLQILLDLDPRVADQRYLNDLTIAQLAAFLDQPLPDHVRLTWRLEDRTLEAPRLAVAGSGESQAVFPPPAIQELPVVSAILPTHNRSH